MAGPWITEKEVHYATEAAASAWYQNANSFNNRFETAFAAYVERQHAVSLPSCTSAIHLSLVALGVGPGDEVIVPDATWIASAAPVNYVGATPVFVDIDDETWCISPEAVQAAITTKTKAVIAVDLYGGMPHMNRLLEVLDGSGIQVIEDAAEAIGSEYYGRKAGAFGAASVFSFHGSKTLTTGEGGMVVCDDDLLYQRMLVLRDHGRQPGDFWFFNGEVAFKYKMSAVQAALGLGQLERIHELVEKKRQIFEWYRARLEPDQRLTLNPEPAETVNSYWMPTILLDPAISVSKRALFETLREKGVDTRPFFHPLSSIPAYSATMQAEKARRINTSSYEISSRGLNLPSPLKMTEADVDYVSEMLLSILDRVS
ncbi:MAG: DegT/DnrJ/EryC1/StrS family aminotransferase [Actinomycetota bacterium]|nr:DegT/DnrJ/EryC1/StrS family aminotransferase [Actinomycetota bacterium]